MNETESACRYCGGPIVRLPECRWCGMVVATIGEAADWLWGDEEAEPHHRDIHVERRSEWADSGEEGP